MARKQAHLNLDTRDHLLEVAARLVGSQGYMATSMRAIAQQAGIEAASIYHHFASKEELVDEVIAHGHDLMVGHIRQHLERLGHGASAEARFRTAVFAQMSAVTVYGDYTIASDRLLSQLPERVRERQVHRRADHQKMWSALVEDLRRQGTLRSSVDPVLLRLFIQACVNSAPAWFDPSKGSLEHVAGQLCDMFLDGARQAPSRGPATAPGTRASD